MGAGPPQVIRAPLAAPPRVGLLKSVASPEVDPGWQNGIAFEPERCAVGGYFDPCNTQTLTITASGSRVTFEPFGIWAGEKCSALGYNARDYEGRARRQLAAVASFLIAREFWTGTQADIFDNTTASYSDNGRLATVTSDDLTGTGGPLSTVNALACLEQYIGQCNGGQRGMIHATRQLVSLWHQGGALRFEGGLILTINDTIVIPDGGYDGSGPNGQPAVANAQFAYATDEVQVLLSDVSVTPTRTEDQGATNRGVNTIEVRAWQAVGIIWPKCCHGVVRVDTPLCGIGGGS